MCHCKENKLMVSLSLVSVGGLSTATLYQQFICISDLKLQSFYILLGSNPEIFNSLVMITSKILTPCVSFSSQFDLKCLYYISGFNRKANELPRSDYCSLWTSFLELQLSELENTVLVFDWMFGDQIKFDCYSPTLHQRPQQSPLFLSFLYIVFYSVHVIL